MSNMNKNMFTVLQKENDTLLQSQTELDTTDDQRAIHQSVINLQYKIINNALFYIYYCLAIIFGIYVFRKYTSSKIMIGVLAFLLIIYPYIAGTIALTFINLLRYICALIFGYVYTPI